MWITSTPFLHRLFHSLTTIVSIVPLNVCHFRSFLWGCESFEKRISPPFFGRIGSLSVGPVALPHLNCVAATKTEWMAVSRILYPAEKSKEGGESNLGQCFFSVGRYSVTPPEEV